MLPAVLESAASETVSASREVVPIEYGYPGPEMIAEAERGEIELGGCCVMDRDPTATGADRPLSYSSSKDFSVAGSTWPWSGAFARESAIGS